MHVGHSSPWTNRLGLGKYSKSQPKSLDDYMDRFLEYYFQKHEHYLKQYLDYAKEFTPDDFGMDHFIEGIYVKNNEVMKFSDKEADDIVTEMCNKIEERADRIVCEKGTELFDCFSKLRIIGETENSK